MFINVNAKKSLEKVFNEQKRFFKRTTIEGEPLKEYDLNSNEYLNLFIFARAIREFFDEIGEECSCEVEKTYFDYGADWSYTSVNVRVSKIDLGYQCLEPKDYELVISGNVKAIEKIFENEVKRICKFKLQLAKETLMKLEDGFKDFI